METKEPICKRCGECCYFVIDGVRKKCKHLIKFPKTGRTVCNIYSNRDPCKRIVAIAKDGTKICCNYRENVPMNYPDCPYNKPGQPPVTDEIYTKIWGLKNAIHKKNI